MLFEHKQSLKDLLMLHELAFILLIFLSALAGGIGINIWQKSSQETQRIGSLINEVQQTRGDLYRQMKELFDAFFLDDAGAHEEYNHFTQSVEAHFRELNHMAIGVAEKKAISDLHQNYQQFVKQTSELLNQKETWHHDQNKSGLKRALNTDIETGLFTQYERILARTEKLLTDQQQVLDVQLINIKRTSTILLIIPLVLSIFLLIFSRLFLKRAIVKPINEVLNATSEISAGNLAHRASEEGVAEIAALSTAVNGMANQLSISQQALVKTEKQAAQGLLVPMLAHNIRNPLASIRATAQVLDGPELDTYTRESLIGIIQTVDRLERWTGALLSYLHPLKPQLTQTTLSHILQGACLPLQQKLKEKDISLKLPIYAETIKMFTDEHLLEQVIYNFLINAIDASQKGSEIIIEATNTDDATQICILDHGCGMPFTPDPSAMNSPTTKRFGTGLGIPFGFKVCEAIKAELAFATRPQGGTLITMTLPKVLNFNASSRA